MKEKCLKTLSEYCELWCRCHVRWKTITEGGAGSPFAEGRDWTVVLHVGLWKSRAESLSRYAGAMPCTAW